MIGWLPKSCIDGRNALMKSQNSFNLKRLVAAQKRVARFFGGETAKFELNCKKVLDLGEKSLMVLIGMVMGLSVNKYLSIYLSPVVPI